MQLYKEMYLCFEKIEQNFAMLDLEEFMKSDYRHISQYHFGMGTWIRNTVLGKGSKLYDILMEGGIYTTDDMSALIISLFYIYMNTKHRRSTPRS